MEKPRGLSMIQILVLVSVILLVGAGVFVMVRSERSKGRDAKRMADMARLSAAFFELYATEGSYETAALGCGEVGASVASCNLTSYLPDISAFSDPQGGQYIVQGVPGEASYVVLFSLENSYSKYPAGQHALTQDGIQ
jgi:hypothetical protein